MDEESPSLSESHRNWFRGIIAFVIVALLVGNVTLFSMYQALWSRVEAHDRRIERLQKMVTDMLEANQNAERIEKIEVQVDNIGVQVTGLTVTLKAQDAEAEAKKASPKKRRR